MKQLVILFLSILLTWIVTACTSTPETPSAEPIKNHVVESAKRAEPAPVPQEHDAVSDDLSPQSNKELTETSAEPNIAAYEGNGFYGFPITHIHLHSEQTADVDNCGQDEQIQLLLLFDDHGQESYALRVVKDGQSHDSTAPIRYDPSIWIADLDKDGLSEIFFNGDCASDDYVVYGWHLSDTGLQPLSEQEDGFLFRGKITSINEPMIDIVDYHHLLGSRYLSRSYTYDTQNGISVAFNWTGGFHGDPLIPIRDLPCKINGTDTTVAAGTPLWLTFYDGEEQVILSTEDGTEAVITYTDQKINGVPESEYFENLMYAG